ncbi:uncharacterized protein LACBIDRAFT_303115 [Laccaria bicolor S238N-H82]|uniref:Predicted protein n=1 Tax=Laccaria bicolor (strain S238N-H82 / ATCC MYA-4686) TaxID=486041 RepID=B0DIY8_LACBS|nr:uncharacterized protein LACBIDRAFT_303115 [Laccaria bicolor S238N-H82]EDR05425.1 predicted protein [Laccaria bicolor S238N-H82]|eukprot:XP_001883983.1 predicted protein [Laccaria bicolor S238N-H82]
MKLFSIAICLIATLYTAAPATAIKEVCSNACDSPIPFCIQGYTATRFNVNTPNQCWRYCQAIPDDLGMSRSEGIVFRVLLSPIDAF